MGSKGGDKRMSPIHHNNNKKDHDYLPWVCKGNGKLESMHPNLLM